MKIKISKANRFAEDKAELAELSEELERDSRRYPVVLKAYSKRARKREHI